MDVSYPVLCEMNYLSNATMDNRVFTLWPQRPPLWLVKQSRHLSRDSCMAIIRHAAAISRNNKRPPHYLTE